MSTNVQTYWATEPTDTIGDEIWTRVTDYYQWCGGTRLLDDWQQRYWAYYGQDYDGAPTAERMVASGAVGELTRVCTNHFRNVIKHSVALATQSKPAFKAIPRTNGSEALAQAKLATRIIRAEESDKGGEQILRQALESERIFGEGFVVSLWDSTAGEQVGEELVNDESGLPIGTRPVHAGETWHLPLFPWEVARDVRVPVPRTDRPKKLRSGSPWIAFRVPVNRWDLAAEYEEKRDEILGAPAVTTSSIAGITQPSWSPWTATTIAKVMEPDVIYQWWFFHDRTPALPNGREVILIDGGEVLRDGPLPYDSLPIERVCADPRYGTAIGYGMGGDLVGLQRAHNAVTSAMTSLAKAYGVAPIFYEAGSVGPKDDIFGLKAVPVLPGHRFPEPGNLLDIPKELFDLADMYKNGIELVSGINSVVRGEPESSLKSGAALAAVQSQAIHYINGVVAALLDLAKRWGTRTMRLYQQHAKAPRVTMLAGSNGQYEEMSFSSDMIATVSRVELELVNPMLSSFAGRIEFANEAQSRGLLRPENAQELNAYIRLIATGDGDVASSPIVTEAILIEQENELILKGIVPDVLFSDDDELHIKYHDATMNNPYSRLNEKARNALDQHRAMHEQNMAVKAPPPPPEEMPLEGPGAPPPPEGAGGGAQLNELGEQMPQLPINPIDGQRMATPDGALGGVPA